MKYPAHTESNPLSSEEAKKVIRAVKSGRPLSSPESRAMIERIKEKYGLISTKTKNGKKHSTLPKN